jgi:hypothetical protein
MFTRVAGITHITGLVNSKFGISTLYLSFPRGIVSTHGNRSRARPVANRGGSEDGILPLEEWKGESTCSRI